MSFTELSSDQPKYSSFCIVYYLKIKTSGDGLVALGFLERRVLL